MFSQKVGECTRYLLTVYGVIECVFLFCLFVTPHAIVYCVSLGRPMTSDGIANESHSVDLYHHHYQQNQHGNLVRAGDRSGDPDVLLPRWGCGGSLTDQQMVLETHRLPSLTSTPLTSPPLTSPPLTSPPLPSPPSRQQSVALQPMADLWRGSSSATKELDQLMASLSDFKVCDTSNITNCIHGSPWSAANRSLLVVSCVMRPFQEDRPIPTRLYPGLRTWTAV